jgi:hypothetical protein
MMPDYGQPGSKAARTRQMVLDRERRQREEVNTAGVTSPARAARIARLRLPDSKVVATPNQTGRRRQNDPPPAREEQALMRETPKHIRRRGA